MLDEDILFFVDVFSSSNVSVDYNLTVVPVDNYILRWGACSRENNNRRAERLSGVTHEKPISTCQFWEYSNSVF